MSEITTVITTLENIPTREDPANFDEYADDFLGRQLPNMTDEMNTWSQEVNAVAADVTASKEAAATSADIAKSAESGAIAAASIAAWNPSPQYYAGNCVYGTDGHSYRAIQENTATDPVTDTGANWTCLTRTPAGAVQAFAMATPPVGWLECDGSAVSRTTYARLYAAIGDTYGSGNGSTTFNIPDLRGEFIRGWDSGRGVDSGRNLGTNQSDDLQPHTHMWGVIDFANATTGGSSIRHLGRSYTNGDITDEYRTSSTGGDETRPRNVALMYAIKY